MFADTRVLDGELASIEPRFDFDKVAEKIIKSRHEQSYENYRATIDNYARVNNVDNALIAAIIKVESNFDKNAVSATNALGLMQVKLDQAVSDVYKNNFGRKDLPSKEQLFEPQFNISIGTAYLSLMSNKYFKDIKDPKSKEYCVIAAYNAGAGTVLRTFHEDKLIAQSLINTYTPDEVLEKLKSSMASEQGRKYIQKVLEAKDEFDGVKVNSEKNIVYFNSLFSDVTKR